MEAYLVNDAIQATLERSILFLPQQQHKEWWISYLMPPLTYGHP